MTPEQAIKYCLEKPSAYLDYPFGLDVTILKVGKTDNRPGKIFAQIFVLRGQDSITLNCDLMTGLFYRDFFPGVVVGGYHCPPIQKPYFNTMPLVGGVPDEIIYEMIDHSYKTVTSKLPKYIQRML